MLYLVFVILVQHECIPQAILGMDILCQAKSGMGKTAVFVLATLQQIEPVDGQVRNLLFKSLSWYSNHLQTVAFPLRVGVRCQDFFY